LPSWLNYPGEGGKVLYGEELFMGYRGFEERGTEPRWPFGHGLGYSTVHWASVTGDRDRLPLAGTVPERGRAALRVEVELSNSGDHTAHEVVQCYVHDGSGQLRRPDQELRGFTKVELAPGSSGTAVVELDERAFAAWDPDAHAWTVSPGTYEVRVGASSQDLRGELVVEVVDPD
jgi:beta-glucosidase